MRIDPQKFYPHISDDDYDDYDDDDDDDDDDCQIYTVPDDSPPEIKKVKAEPGEMTM